jgi:hypothetical protein
MIAIFWLPLSFPVIQALPPKMTFTAKFFVSIILPDIVAANPACSPDRRLVLYIDNASPYRVVLITQKLEENGIAASLHLVLSLNFAPCEFFSLIH